MENVEEEMKRINVMIKSFYDNSLLGASRDVTKDTFSEVTASLEAILKDLAQDRVNIMPKDGGEENYNRQAT